MAGLRRLCLVVLDFVVGDDWQVAVGVVVALGVTAVVAHVLHGSAWWVMPLAVAVMLPWSVVRVLRRAR
jgi:hypothetical protein